jgi:long-chain fatty acid transport protein
MISKVVATGTPVASAGFHQMSLNMNNLKKILLVVWLSGSWAAGLLGNGFGLPDQDAFATGRGEAFVATADNPSAIYYNPAGISQMNGDNLRGGIYGIYYDPSYRPPAGAPNSGNTYHSSYDLAAVPELFYVHTLKKLPLSFGLGVYFPYGGTIDWPQNTGFQPIAVSASLKYVTINPEIAWKVLPSLSVGAGAMVNYAHMKTSQSIYPNTANFFDFEGSGWSAGYNAGILWKPIKQVSIGATFRSSADVTLNGQTHYQSLPVTAATYSSANMNMNFPWTIVGGISYRPTPKWNLEFDANYTDWSTFGTFNLYEESPRRPFQPDYSVNFDWQGSWMYEFGVTRYFAKEWHISAGYAFNENSVPDAYYTPWAADLDRDFFSVGLGRTGKRFDFDIAYQLGYGPTHTVTGSKPSLSIEGNSNKSADGQYGFFSSALILTAGIHF